MILTETDIRTINRARDVLNRLAKDADTAAWKAPASAMQDGPYSHWYGRMAERASQADSSLFEVLNFATNYLDIEMTDEQIYNRPDDEGDGREPDGTRLSGGLTIQTDR